MDFFQEFEKKLRENGYKLTQQRKVILEIMYNRKAEHLTAEEIHNILKEDHPEIGLATVYRSLQLLTQLSLLDTLHLDDNIVRYELHTDADRHRHHHLICSECGSIAEVNEDMLDDIEAEIEKRFGFKVENHVLKLFGTCKDCLKKVKN